MERLQFKLNQLLLTKIAETANPNSTARRSLHVEFTECFLQAKDRQFPLSTMSYLLHNLTSLAVIFHSQFYPGGTDGRRGSDRFCDFK